MNAMDNQLMLQEQNYKRYKILLHLLYSYDNTPYLRKMLIEENMLLNKECYRVIMIAMEEQDDVKWDKMRMYLSMPTQKEYDYYVVETEPRNALVMIAGMSKKAERHFDLELLHIYETIEKNVSSTISFFEGELCSDIGQIHTSYVHILNCRQNPDKCQKRCEGNIYICAITENEEKSENDPSIQLSLLFSTIVSMDLDRVISLTDELLDELQNCQADGFERVVLYYDIVNTYYKAQIRLESDGYKSFLESPVIDADEREKYADSICQIRDHYRAYVEAGNKTELEKEDDLITRVMQFINKNITAPEMCVSMVADHFGMSISNLSHRFKDKTNNNISNYIIEQRIVRACELLVQTDYDIKEIALMVGYSSPVSLIRRIKQKYNMTPMEYRIEKRMAAASAEREEQTVEQNASLLN